MPACVKRYGTELLYPKGSLDQTTVGNRPEWRGWMERYWSTTDRIPSEWIDVLRRYYRLRRGNMHSLHLSLPMNLMPIRDDQKKPIWERSKIRKGRSKINWLSNILLHFLRLFLPPSLEEYEFSPHESERKIKDHSVHQRSKITHLILGFFIMNRCILSRIVFVSFEYSSKVLNHPRNNEFNFCFWINEVSRFIQSSTSWLIRGYLFTI